MTLRLTVNMSRIPPLITVVLPHYGCERFLHQAAASILSQSILDLELRIVDDYSDDASWMEALHPLMSDTRLKLYRTSLNVGPYRIINRLLESIRSPFIAFQDADDFSAPSRLARELEFLQKTGAHVVGCGFININEDGRHIFRRRMVKHVNFWHRLGKTFLCHHPTTIVRREVFDTLQGFDGATRIGADTDFILRASYLFKIRNMPASLYLQRLLQDSLSRSSETGFDSEIRNSYKAVLRERHRALKKIKALDELSRALRAEPNDVDFQLEEIHP